ncbi:hypothetical protein GJ496_007965 [Pomphorhynchus laevis]|nr:hypothetical protein GJ496_007965 [Pomphorhynchus laevis]
MSKHQLGSVDTFVGFANLPNQVHRKIAKKGFEFTLMVVGPCGLGKSTLINSLFLTDLYPNRKIAMASEMLHQQTVRIQASTVEIEEGGVKVKLTLVDTPGYNDSLNVTNCYQPILEYIDTQFEKYLKDESGLNRKNISDNRVHCVFFFISPFGHGLRAIDIECLQALQTRVNIVPIIGRADALTTSELANLKALVLKQLADNKIKIYEIPALDNDPVFNKDDNKQTKSNAIGDNEQLIDDDAEFFEQNRRLRKTVPFAVCGSREYFELKSSNGRRVRGRMYQWGMVDIENSEHCDFVLLRAMLTTHMQDLQEITHEVHYEQYRSEKLNIKNDQDQILKEKEAELKAVQEMLAKMKAEMIESGCSVTNEAVSTMELCFGRLKIKLSLVNVKHRLVNIKILFDARHLNVYDIVDDA